MFIGVSRVNYFLLTFIYLKFLFNKYLFSLNFKILNYFVDLDSIQSSFKSVVKEDILIRSEIKNKSGVYMFYNNINNKKYIGSSVNLERRFRAHIISTKFSNLPLYRAIRKYGLDNLTYLILEYCEANYVKCIALEQNYIDFYDPEYNVLKIAGG